MKFGKWLGGGLGWVLGGPLGGVLGFALGSLFDKAELIEENQKDFHGYSKKSSGRHTGQGDFIVSLLVLAAAVMKSDGKTLRSELDYLKQFLVRQFGEQAALQQLQIFKKILEQDIPLEQVCEQIKSHMPSSARLQLIHFLYGISQADGNVSKEEVKIIDRISSLLGIPHVDVESVKATYYRDTKHDYIILETDERASDEEIKKAYRKMAMKYHPDKLAGLGEAVQKAGEEKFRRVQEAYENIKKQRGMV